MATPNLKTTKTIKRARAFSLLEIIICIAILALISGSLSIKIKETIEHQRFENSISRFLCCRGKPAARR